MSQSGRHFQSGVSECSALQEHRDTGHGRDDHEHARIEVRQINDLAVILQHEYLKAESTYC